MIIHHYDLSQRDFADKIGTSESAVSAMLANKRPVSQKTLSKILKTFKNVNPSWLMFGEGEMFLSEEEGKEPIGKVLDERDIQLAELRLKVKFLEEQIEAKDGQIDEKDKQLAAALDMLKKTLDKLD